MVLKKLSKNEWDDPELLGDRFLRCIEYLEHIGLYSTVEGDTESKTCMDYLLSSASSHRGKNRLTRPLYIAVRPDSYNGSNTELRDKLRLHYGNPNAHYGFPFGSLYYGGLNYKEIEEIYIKTHLDGEGFEDFCYRKWGHLVDFTTAVTEFYFNNPFANPEESHCNIVVDDPRGGLVTTPVNCLTKFIEVEENTALNTISTIGYEFGKHHTRDSILNIINSGSQCGMYNGTTFTGLVTHHKTSCLEAVMNAEVDQASSGKVELKPYSFGRNIDKYDMSIGCISSSGSRQIVPCIQKLTQTLYPHKYRNYLQSFPYYDDAMEKLGNVLMKRYKFEKLVDDDLPESTALDYMVNNGINLEILLGTNAALPLFLEEACVLHGKHGDVPISCFSKLLMNLKNDDAHYTDDLDQKHITCLSLENSRFANPIIDSECYEGDTPVPCLSTLVDIVSKQRYLSGMLSDIMAISPISDFECAEKKGEDFQRVNCLDKIIGCSTSGMMESLRDSGLLIDHYDCTDWDGKMITCIDKLFQRHEMWVHNYFRAREISYMRKQTPQNLTERLPDDAEVYANSVELTELSNKYSINGDPGFRLIANEYDLGAVKVHSPSKAFVDFRHVVESQLNDYRSGVVPAGADQVRYTQELLRSITSDTASKEKQVAPRIYRLLDVYNPMFVDRDDYGVVGVMTMVSPERPSPLTLNMPECRDTEADRTIICLQKQIDVVDQLVRGNYGNKRYINAVMEYKDLFKPGLCIQPNTGNKISCMEYAYKKMHDVFDDSTYIALISRKDFGKIADVEIDMEDSGKIKLLDAVCGTARLESIAQYLYDTKSHHTVTNGNPSFDGSALALYEKCICADRKTPMDRRICMDTECFSSYIGGHPGHDDDEDEDGDDRDNRSPHWAYGYIGGRGENGNFNEDAVREAMLPQIYHDSTDYFGLAGVYELTYQPSKYRIKSTDRFDYDFAVKNTLFPAIRRVEGTTLARFGNKRNVKIKDVYLDEPSASTGDDYIIRVQFSEPGKDGVFEERYSAASIFLRGGLLNQEDVRMKAIRFQNENDVVEKILTKGTKGSESTSRIKLIISNRPADFMRSSTCQDWRSCMHLNFSTGGSYNDSLPFFMGMGGYVAYIASDEFSPSWYARSLLMPVMRYKRGDERKVLKGVETDPNNTFRGNSVYGISMYKPLLKDAIQVLLREHDYNEEGSYKTKGDSEGFICDSYNVKKIKEDVWMNARREAYRNCLEKVVSGEVITLPSKTVIKTDEDCSFLLKLMSEGGVRPREMHASGLLSDTTFLRFGTLGKWHTDYLDVASIPYEIDDMDLREIRRKVSLQYVKPLTTPAGDEGFWADRIVFGGNVNA